jgi:hypothetical protein
LRRGTALNSNEWKTIPWTTVPKTPRDYLTDVLLDLPLVSELTENFVLCTDAARKEELRVMAIETTWEADRRLQKWVLEHCPIDPSTDESVAASMPAIHGNLALAYMMTHYWGACLLVYSSLRTMCDPYIELPPRTELRRYCRYQASLIPVFYQPDSGVAGRHLVTFTVVSALCVLRAIDQGATSAEHEGIMRHIETYGFVKKVSENTFPDPSLRRCFAEMMKLERQRQLYAGLRTEARAAGIGGDVTRGPTSTTTTEAEGVRAVFA